MQNPSLENINPSNLRNFLVKICIVSNKYTERDFAVSHFQTQLERPTEEGLRGRIRQLEKELQQTKEEKDKALEKNRIKINELNNELASVKAMVKDLLQAKKERIMHLEDKVKKTAKI